MLPYWLLFAIWTAGALQTERSRSQGMRFAFFLAASAITIFMIGLRLEVGGDWGAYQRMYESIFFLSLSDALPITDTGYGFLNWVSAQIDGGVYLVNLVCACLFVGGFAYLCTRQPNPALAMLVSIPYLVIVVAMGYTRQAAAIGVICYAITSASERHLLRLVLLIGVAALMHKTAILILPIALYPIFRRNLLLGAFGLGLFAALFVLLLRSASDALITSYVQGTYDSQGALIRVSMNVLAAILFLWKRDRIEMPDYQKMFWSLCSILALVSLVALFSASASSGIDRISLYLIPLQAIVYSRLPYMLSADSRRGLPSVVIAVVGYSFAVQYVWLNYADNASYWLPYRSAVFAAS